MFSFARTIVRHKIAAIAIVGAGIFFLMPAEEEVQEPSSPWAVRAEQPTTVAQAEEGGFIDDMMTEATEFLDENGLNPSDKADAAVDRFGDTASAYSRANKD